LAAGAAIGLGEVATFAALGARFAVAGYDVTAAIFATFGAVYAAIGYLVGRLAMARAKANQDARTIAHQYAELERAHERAVEHEKLAAIGRMAAGVAHEVRNPLGVIRASAAMVRDTLEPGDDRRACEFIVEETDRLESLVGSLLDYARPAHADVRPVVLGDVAWRAVRLAEAHVREAASRITVSGGEEPIVARVDPDLLSRALLNLILNAIEATGSGGTVEVRLDDPNTGVTIEVADDGPGIPAEAAQQVFEPFYTTKAKGTGLGLAMASRIVEAHGGRIVVVLGAGAGPDGKGACLRIELPSGTPADAAADEDADFEVDELEDFSDVDYFRAPR
jgi:two-component system sensor histidine kinase HydH